MIGAVVAMESEAQILIDIMDVHGEYTVSGKKIYCGRVGSKDVTLIICGIGKVNAAIGAQIVIDKFNADVLLNFGVAGGIKENTSTREAYAIERAVQYDFDLAELNNTKIGTLDEFKENYMPLNVYSASLPKRALATGDRFNDDKNDYLLIKDYMQADIRDMEGAAVVQTAIHAGLPVYEYKAISDKAGNVSSFEQYRANKEAALLNLKKYLPDIIEHI